MEVTSFFFFIYSGHNTDGKYFINSNRMSFHFETTPKRIVLFIEKSKDGHVTPIDGVQIVDFSCGNNHSVRVPPHPPCSCQLSFNRFLSSSNNSHFAPFRLPSTQRSAPTAGALAVSVALATRSRRTRWCHA